MPRSARILSKTDIYHVMARGVAKMDIFKDDRDRERFLTILEDKRQASNFDILGYCLMDNHIHLLLKTNYESISQCMKRVGTSFASYFNRKYDRVGHLFQDRFKSEPIENERYLLAALRYIHRNPIKGGMVRDPGDYKWSSYSDYLGNRRNTILYVDTQFILSIFSSDTKKAIELFKEFNLQEEEGAFLDVEEGTPVIRGREEAAAYIDEYIKSYNIKKDDLNRREFVSLRNQLVMELINKSNLTQKEIGELLGISNYVVSRIKLK